MQIRLIKPYQYRKVGTEMDIPDGIAEYLILRRFAERLVPPEVLEVAIIPADSSDTTAKRFRRRIVEKL